MNNKNLRPIAMAVLILGLLGYLAMVNFHLPFMTADELRYILGSPKETADYALISGRYSSLLMIPFAEILSFSNPESINLIPRFVSMLLLAAAIFALLKRLGFSNLSALLLVDFILIAHEIDWQHNGLVSFFGIYNVLLALFMLALTLEEESHKKIWIFILVFVLLVGAYASELFIGLSLCYLVLKAIIHRQVRFILHSPFFWSLIAYVFAYGAIKATTSLAHWNAQEMSTYLVGAVGMYSFDQMLTAALLYFINSLPYYHALHLPIAISVVISTLVLIGISGYFIKLVLNMKSDGKTSSEVVVDKREWLLAAMLFLLSVTPNFLLALQPMKVDWILRNASVHYVFSYYTWIGMALVSVYFAKQSGKFINVRADKMVALTLLITGLFLMASVRQTFIFVQKYGSSQVNWVRLNEILHQSKSNEVVIPSLYLQFPYISAFSAEQLKIYAKKYYDVQLKICDAYDELKLSDVINEKIVQLEGFSGVESDGRWTEGAVSTIKLLEENPKINFVELEISAIFFENNNTSVLITKGNKEYKFKINKAGKEKFYLPELVDGPLQIQLQIEQPMSPFKLGMSADTRNLGVMLKTIKVGFKTSVNQENLHAMEHCY